MMIMEKNKIIKKKAKGTKKRVIKRRLMFENYKDCLFNDKTDAEYSKYLLNSLKDLPFLPERKKDLTTKI